MAIDDYITNRDINSVTNALGVVNRINMTEAANERAEETHQRKMTALDQAEKSRNDQNTALTYMQKDIDITDDLGLDPSAVNKAKTLYAQGKQADATVMDLDMKKKIQDRQNEILANLAQWDGKPSEYFQGLVPETSTDMQALLNVRKSINQNDKLAYENMQQLRLTAKVQYEDHKGKMSVAGQYLKAGNTLLAEKAVLSAVNDTPHPVYMEKNAQGNYDLYYEEMGQEKELLAQGSNLSLQQAIQLISSVPPQEAMNILALDMASAQEFNANVKPVVWTNAGSKDAVEVFQMKNPLNPNEPQIVVFEKGGGRLDGMTVDALRQNGYRPEESDAEKLSALKLADAQLDYDNKKSGNAPKDYKALNQQLDNYKKSMALVLAPWNKGNEDMNNMDFSDSGTGPLKLAMDYYQNNRQAFDSGELKGDALEKFQNAADAVRLHGHIRNTINQMHGFEGPAAVPPEPVDHTAEALKIAQSGDQDALQEYLKGIEDPETRKQVIAGLRAEAGKQTASDSDNDLPAQGALAAGESPPQQDPPKGPEPVLEEQSGPPQPVGELNGKPVGSSKYGYMIQEKDGSWREPTAEEQQQIETMARRGQLKPANKWEWKYQNKYPNAMESAMSAGNRSTPQLTPSYRR